MENNSYLWFCGREECVKEGSDITKSKIQCNGPVTQNNRIEASQKFGLGSRYFNASLSKWHASADYQNSVNRWIKNPKNMLIVLGAPGIGKTYLCMAICNFFMESNKNVYYTSTRRFFSDIQKSIQEGKSQYEIILKISKYDILIFDDLGAASNTEWQKEVVLDLMDARYSAEMPTIVTSNLSWTQIKDSLGERTERRLNAPENLKLVIG